MLATHINTKPIRMRVNLELRSNLALALECHPEPLCRRRDMFLRKASKANLRHFKDFLVNRIPITFRKWGKQTSLFWDANYSLSVTRGFSVRLTTAEPT